MKREAKLVAAATAAAMLVGCASGGGSTYGNDIIGDNPIELLLCAPLFICGKKKSATAPSSSAQSASISATPASVAPTTVALTSWSDLPAQTFSEASGPSATTTYQSSGSSTYLGSGSYWATAKTRLEFDAQRNLVYLQSVDSASSFTDLSRIGFDGIDVGLGRVLRRYPVNPSFTSGSDRATGVVANPYVLGWEFQSFGVWNQERNYGSYWVVTGNSFGAATPASAVPASGTTTFAGKLGGLYVSPTGEGSVAAAKLTVNVDFGARSLSFASSGTTLTRDFSTGAAAPGLDLSGRLAYAPGANAFEGTLTSAGGTLAGTTHGQFYGPAAQELGGAFALKASSTVETFTGAYGAKR